MAEILVLRDGSDRLTARVATLQGLLGTFRSRVTGQTKEIQRLEALVEEGRASVTTLETRECALEESLASAEGDCAMWKAKVCELQDASVVVTATENRKLKSEKRVLEHHVDMMCALLSGVSVEGDDDPVDEGADAGAASHPDDDDGGEDEEIAPVDVPRGASPAVALRACLAHHTRLQLESGGESFTALVVEMPNDNEAVVHINDDDIPVKVRVDLSSSHRLVLSLDPEGGGPLPMTKSVLWRMPHWQQRPAESLGATHTACA